MGASGQELLEVRGLSKSFPGVKALEGVDFTLRAGEVHALIGENGAGKSTLIKLLAGVYQPDEGSIFIAGQPIQMKNPNHARAQGVSTVYQEFNLLPHLSVAENVFMGRLPTRNGWTVDWERLYAETEQLLRELSLDVPVRARVQRLGVAQKQLVEVAKAVSMRSQIFIFDEPTAALTGKEVEQLFATIGRLAAQGAGVIYISHRLVELKRIAQTVTVLRDGKVVGTVPIDMATPAVVTQMMIGRDVGTQYPKVQVPLGEPVLTVEDLSTANLLRSVSLTLRRGEIVGLYGLMGSGRTELARAIIGADIRVSGTITVKGKQADHLTPRQAIAQGIGYLPEERRTNGLLLEMSVAHNITLPSLPALSAGQVMNLGKEDELAHQFVEALRIRTPGTARRVKLLSGGNQQKVVLAKWLCAGCDILFFDEPTRGIDVGAKVEVYRLMNDLVSKGAGILMISSELPEVLGMSDRIIVMRDGQIVLEIEAKEATESLILQATLGLQPAFQEVNAQ